MKTKATKGLPTKWLRRKDDAMKYKCRYYNKPSKGKEMQNKIALLVRD